MRCVLIYTAILFAFSYNCYADFLVYEGFDYPACNDISDITVNGGYGFYSDTSWQDITYANGPCAVVTPGLTYINPAGSDLEVRGGALSLNSTINRLGVRRMLANEIGADNTRTGWISFLYYDISPATNTDASSYMVIAKNTIDTFAPGIFIGKKWNQKSFVNRPYAFTSSTQDIGNEYAHGDVYLLLGRFELSDSSEDGVRTGSVTCWKYQSGVDALPTAPPTGGTTVTGTSDTYILFRYVGFFNPVYNGTYTQCIYDELRIASSFADALGYTHEPPETPYTIAPASGSINVSLTPELVTSPFYDIDGDTHTATEWQIYTDTAGASVVWSTNVTSVSLTNITVVANTLTNNTLYYWRARYGDSSNMWSEWSVPGWFFTSQDMSNTNGTSVLLWDIHGDTAIMLMDAGYVINTWDGSVDTNLLLCVGRNTLADASTSPGSLAQFVTNGGRAVVFTQNPNWLRNTCGFRVSHHISRRVFAIRDTCEVTAGLDNEDLRDWNGISTLLPHHDIYAPNDDMPEYGWRWGGRGGVSSAPVEKPHIAGWRPVIESEFDMAYTPLQEITIGKGMLWLCTLDLEDHYSDDPVPRILLDNLIEYAYTTHITPRVKTVVNGNNESVTMITNLLGVVCSVVSSGLDTSASIMIIGPDSIGITDTAVSNYVLNGGTVVFLRHEESNPSPGLGMHLESVHNYSGSLAPPTNWLCADGLSASDLRFRCDATVWLATAANGWDIAADGQLAQKQIGTGTAIFCQLGPQRFDADTRTYFRYTRWRQTRALAQILANCGAVFRADTAFIEQTRAEYYHPDYKTEFILGDDPYRYKRW